MWTFQTGSKPLPNPREQPEHVATDEGREQMSVNTQDMEIIHRESRLLVEFVAAVAPGDTARAKVIADHFRVYRLGLHNHHEGEDELLWPPMLSRVDLGADIVHLVNNAPKLTLRG
jgi:hypothetical protein